ncbi:DUF1697 domain-containing protein [Subtercola frigoramans]|uniref:Uncharacterized protein (DUF1697 family) n=1 Tax=Subtercola frigoramans TaxID=120298 RepID=A0ABS2L714_9MICO|nr:DUF1697 domain-containing protein [Subtercola frigoramans]MBM7472789.1 uncharacterized protein (DUF1697 family) [Subtercola frigoramans]
MNAGGAPGQGANGMHVYVGLVRGINVGSSTLVAMAYFRRLFEDLGYTDVVTLLRSGNVVFTSARVLTAADVTAIEGAFATVAGFRAGFVVLSAEQFLGIAAENTLLDIATDKAKLVVAYVPLGEAGGPVAGLAQLNLPHADQLLPEVIAVGPRAVYVWCANGISNSRVPASFWKQLGPVYTARNVNTVEKLAALVSQRLESGE